MERERNSGQAAVELLGVVCALVLAAAVLGQLVVAAHTWQLVRHAAHVAARAERVGAPPIEAAHSVLPVALASRATITHSREAASISVGVPVPSLIPWIGDLGRVSASVSVGS